MEAFLNCSAAGVSQRFYTGQAFDESVLELMINLTAENESFRELRDFFGGVQGYRGRRARLYRSLPKISPKGCLARFDLDGTRQSKLQDRSPNRSGAEVRISKTHIS